MRCLTNARDQNAYLAAFRLPAELSGLIKDGQPFIKLLGSRFARAREDADQLFLGMRNVVRGGQLPYRAFPKEEGDVFRVVVAVGCHHIERDSPECFLEGGYPS